MKTAILHLRHTKLSAFGNLTVPYLTATNDHTQDGPTRTYAVALAFALTSMHVRTHMYVHSRRRTHSRTHVHFRTHAHWRAHASTSIPPSFTNTRPSQ